MRFLAPFLVVATILGTEVHCDSGCDYSKCQLKCANPDYSVESCCGDCSKSSCQFEGCVRFGAFGPTWYPDPCTSCNCYNGEPVCIKESDNCPMRNCFGHSTITRPGECCPVCDFGIPEDQCGTIPVKETTTTVMVNGEECLQTVIVNECDKEAVRIGDEWYVCVVTETDVDEASTPRPSSCDDVRTVKKFTCEARSQPLPADFSPPSTLPCVPV